MLQFIQKNEPVKIRDITLALEDYTSYTLKKDVKYLTEEGVIKKLGKARATIYVVNEFNKKEVEQVKGIFTPKKNCCL